MSDGIEVDFSDFTKLAADLGAAARPTRANMRAAVEVTARRIKDAWNGKLYTDGHAKYTGRAISYDLDEGSFGFALTALTAGDVKSSTVTAEIGARTGTGKQAGIVRLLENGSIHNAPHGYGAAALQENEADFEAGLTRAVEQGQKAAGL